MNQVLATAIKHWNYVAPLVAHPKTKKDVHTLEARLDELLDIVGENEKHPLMGLIDIVSDLIATYEEEHYSQLPSNKGVNALKFLMESHDLQQADLSEIGSQGVISEILRGKRDLNVRQIKLLAKRFHVTPSTFIDE
jgi:HTH-type transcriptional regulator / antitoxin HigA